MKLKDLMNYGINLLKEANIEDYYLKCKLLLCYILDNNKNNFIINSEEEVCEEMQIEYIEKVNEIIKGKPLQYITHKQEFMGMEFYVDENVLIPQPDTEVLVEEVLKHIHELEKEKKQKEIIKILDLCTGSGAIAVSIAKLTQDNIVVYASDVSKKALEIAEKNANLNQVKIEYILSDMFEELDNMEFDIIVSNPPYIETNVIPTLSKEVQNEPILALDGGEDGLKFYNIISKEADKYLKEDGCIFLEIGYNQSESVTKLFKKENIYNKIETIKDLGDNNRVVIITRK